HSACCCTTSFPSTLQQPCSTLFPYTTLFRSVRPSGWCIGVTSCCGAFARRDPRAVRLCQVRLLRGRVRCGYVLAVHQFFWLRGVSRIHRTWVVLQRGGGR